MNCHDIELLLDQYLRGEMGEEQQRVVGDHITSCASCRFKLTVLEDSRSLDEDSEVPASFTSAWQQHIKEEANPVKQGNRALRWLSMAAVLVLLIGGTYLTGQQRRGAQLVPRSTDQASYGGSTQPGIMPAMEEASGDMMMSMRDANPAQTPEEKTAEKIIRTVRMELSTRSFQEDQEAIRALVARSGGRIEQSQLYTAAGNLRRLELTLRVPSDELDKVTTSLKGVGKLLYFTESAEDISERYTDTQNRLTTQQTKMERLQELLKKAESVEDLIAIEGSISDTQYELDRLTGLLRGMDSKVDYSTLNLTLNELSPIETSKDQDETLLERIKNGMSAAFTEFTYLMGDLVVFLTIALPYILVLITLIILIKLVIKRRKNK